jgi:hypothetical protein
MNRFDGEVISTDEMMRAKADEILNNPVAAGLAKGQEDYSYSSARNCILGVHSILKMETNGFE